jgi:hypothetical protein
MAVYLWPKFHCPIKRQTTGISVENATEIAPKLENMILG